MFHSPVQFHFEPSPTRALQEVRVLLTYLKETENVGPEGNRLGAALLQRLDEDPEQARVWLQSFCSYETAFHDADWPFEHIFVAEYEAAPKEEQEASDAYAALDADGQFAADMKIADAFCAACSGEVAAWLRAVLDANAASNDREQPFLLLDAMYSWAMDLQALWDEADSEATMWPEDLEFFDSMCNLQPALEQVGDGAETRLPPLPKQETRVPEQVPAASLARPMSRREHAQHRTYTKPLPEPSQVPDKTARRKAKKLAQAQASKSTRGH